MKNYIEERVEIDPESGCWNWTKSKNPKGYGRVKVQGKCEGAHRVSYRVFNGVLPEGAHVLHKCDNPGCVNPEHLFIGTNADNVADKIAKGRQRQPKGSAHPRARLTEEKVMAIRVDARTREVIAAEYGVTVRTIEAVQWRENWTHI